MKRMTYKVEGGCGFIWAVYMGSISQDVIDRLAAYEDTGLMPDDVTDLMAAHGTAIGKLAEYRMREEKKAPKCYSPDTGGGCKYLVYDGDDEPIDKCKRCPLCYVDKYRHRLPPNGPLTLEELRGMDGEPVWIERRDGGVSGWAIFGDMKSPHGVYFGTAIGGLRLPYDEYGKAWLAYRRKLEEGTV